MQVLRGRLGVGPDNAAGGGGELFFQASDKHGNYQPLPPVTFEFPRASSLTLFARVRVKTPAALRAWPASGLFLPVFRGGGLLDIAERQIPKRNQAHQLSSV